MGSDPRQVLQHLYWTAVNAVIPYDAVKEALSGQADLFHERPIYVIAFGKASPSMALAVEDTLGTDTIIEGIAITKYGHIPKDLPEKVEVFEAGHPVPDEAGILATRKVLEMAEKTGPEALCICLISGGGSALLVSPAEGLSLEDKQTTTDLLLRSGCDIFELNTVRKHLSSVKGGRLTEALYPSEVLSLILSDVFGDRLDVIASGPTVPDPTTYSDAYEVLKRYDLLKRVPKSVITHIERGIKGEAPETPKPASHVFLKTKNRIIGNLHRAIETAKAEAERLGFKTRIITETLQGEASEAAKFLAQEAKNTSGPVVLISGGETTVKVRGHGKGGRNMELALAFAIEIKDTKGIYLLSAGTDGTDGPTEAAGAIVESNTYQKAKSIGLDPERFLEENDSYTFFSKTGDVFISGPTGTNVMDIQIIMVQ